MENSQFPPKSLVHPDVPYLRTTLSGMINRNLFVEPAKNLTSLSMYGLSLPSRYASLPNTLNSGMKMCRKKYSESVFFHPSSLIIPSSSRSVMLCMKMIPSCSQPWTLSRLVSPHDGMRA